MFLKFDEGKTGTIHGDCDCFVDSSCWLDDSKGLIGNYKGTDVYLGDSVTDRISEITDRMLELEKKIETLMKEEKEQGIRAQRQTLQFK